jgi:hypothetical protein
MFRATKAQTGWELLRHLESPEVINARAKVQLLTAPPSLDEDTRVALDKVTRIWDTIGSVIRYGDVPKDMLSNTWGGAIVRDWNITLPLVTEIREGFPGARSNFQWLADEMDREGWRWESGRIYRIIGR